MRTRNMRDYVGWAQIFRLKDSENPEPQTLNGRLLSYDSTKESFFWTRIIPERLWSSKVDGSFQPTLRGKCKVEMA